ncbi:MAG TPA: hypothetical protein VFI24_23380 [Pyrinomonadaceae bacterium]|nr:hypothetical protein [Pyrinomonadaceae bacterium]
MPSARKRLIEDLLDSGLRTPFVETYRGITENEAFVAHGVLKAGPPKDIDQELGIYQDLQDRLGAHYNQIFPKVFLRHHDEQLAVIEITWLGRSLNEEVFKPLAWGEWSTVLARWPDAPPIVARLSMADEAVSRTLDHLETLFAASQRHDPALASAFVSETIAALRVNLRRAGLLPELNRDLAAIEESRDLWSAGLAVSCCHRDLMVEHIYLAHREGALDVGLADPRSGFPHFDETPAGRARIPNSLGCAAVDLAHLELSLVRRQLELKHIHAGTEVVALERVRKSVNDWVTRGRFSGAFYELAMATWYANYAGWPPALGKVPPPEKEWLFDLTVTQARQCLARCGALARGEEGALP